MKIEQFNSMPDSEILRRLYVSQLRTQMDVQQILNNVMAIRKKIEPEAFSTDRMKDDNPYHWEHLSEINKTMEDMYKSFVHQLNEDSGGSNMDNIKFSIKTREE